MALTVVVFPEPGRAETMTLEIAQALTMLCCSGDGVKDFGGEDFEEDLDEEDLVLMCSVNCFGQR